MRQSTYCAMKEGALIAMRSLLFTLGAKNSGKRNLYFDIDKDNPTNPLRPGGAIFTCDHLKEPEFKPGGARWRLLEEILNAGSRAAAHLVDDEAKINHGVNETRLRKGILYVSYLIKTRIYEANPGWNWKDFIAAEQKDHAQGQF